MKNSQDDKIALKVDHLSVYYGRLPALWDLSFSIPQGKLIGVVGPNGAGKSTLLKAVLNLIEPTSGLIWFYEKPYKEMRENIAYVPQKESVDWSFPITVEELVLMGSYGRLRLCQRPRKKDYYDVDRCLEMVGMEALRKRQIGELSGGQQQRAFLARALLEDALIYFMDEPFVGIDHTTEMLLIDLLKEMQKLGKTVFVVHHDLNTVRATFDYAILVNQRLIAAGPIDTVLTKSHLEMAYGKYHILLEEAYKKA